MYIVPNFTRKLFFVLKLCINMHVRAYKVLFLASFLLLYLSPPYAWAQEDELLIEDFSKGVDSFGVPVDWEIVKKTGSPTLEIKQENDTYVLHLISEKNSFGLKKNIRVDIHEYPYITFTWKVEALPKDGDFREKKTDDQAAQLYVVFGKFKLLANIIGYIWDNKAPKFTSGTSPAWNRSRIVVLQSGCEKLNTWVTETRNIYEDYKNLFGENPGKANLITLYINSQHTESRAESYFGKISFLKNRKSEFSPMDEEMQQE